MLNNTEPFEALELWVIFNEPLDSGIQFTARVLDVDLRNYSFLISLFISLVLEGLRLPTKAEQPVFDLLWSIGVPRLIPILVGVLFCRFHIDVVQQAEENPGRTVGACLAVYLE